MKKNSCDKKSNDLLGLNTEITRRDFVGGTLLGSGAALLAMKSPSLVRKASAQSLNTSLTGLGPDWTGPGGLGDYKGANGNTHEVINAAHAAIRNREYDAQIKNAIDSDGTYDLVIVGAGFAGLSATLAYTLDKKMPGVSSLIITQSLAVKQNKMSLRLMVRIFGHLKGRMAQCIQ